MESKSLFLLPVSLCFLLLAVEGADVGAGLAGSVNVPGAQGTAHTGAATTTKPGAQGAAHASTTTTTKPGAHAGAATTTTPGAHAGAATVGNVNAPGAPAGTPIVGNVNAPGAHAVATTVVTFHGTATCRNNPARVISNAIVKVITTDHTVLATVKTGPNGHYTASVALPSKKLPSLMGVQAVIIVPPKACGPQAEGTQIRVPLMPKTMSFAPR